MAYCAVSLRPEYSLMLRGDKRGNKDMAAITATKARALTEPGMYSAG